MAGAGDVGCLTPERAGLSRGAGRRSVSKGRRSPPRSAAEPGAAGSGRGPRPRAETGLPRPRSRGGRCRREDALGYPLAPPGPGAGDRGPGPAELPTPPPGVRPPGPAIAAAAAAPAPVRPPPTPTPGFPASRPASPAARSPGAARRRGPPPLPEGQTCGPLPGGPTAREAATGAGPQRQRRPRPPSARSALPRPGPRPPVAQLPARARPGRVALPTCSAFSAAIAARPGRGQPGASGGRSRLGPGPPQPPLGRGASGRRPHGRRPPAPRRPGPGARCSAGRTDRLPGRLLAPRPPARSRRRRRRAASSSPSLCSFSFASSGAEVGKPAPAAGDHRELKQETPGRGENPGGVERVRGAAGTCRLNPAAGAARRPRPSAPRAPSLPGPARGPHLPAPLPGHPFAQQEHASSPGGQGNRGSDFSGQVPRGSFALLSINRNEENPRPSLARPVKGIETHEAVGMSSRGRTSFSQEAGLVGNGNMSRSSLNLG